LNKIIKIKKFFKKFASKTGMCLNLQHQTAIKKIAAEAKS
jgi:hypothetical protein